MPPTYKDIQNLTGLSLATISKYFNGGTVREANRLAIAGAVEELDYRVNGLARSLRTRRTRTVGVLLPELHNDFHLSIIDGVEAVLRTVGIGVLVSSSRHDHMPGQEHAVDLLLHRQVDAIIAVPNARDGPSLRSAAHRGMPIVLVDRLLDEFECDAVVLDNRGASARVVDELTALGHQRVGIVVGTEEVWTMRERLAGFKERMDSAGIRVPAEMVRQGPLTIEFGENATQALLDAPQPPTAVYASNYELTVGALRAVAVRGIQVPKELSVVGFDGREIAAITSPPTSVLVQPVREIGMAAADLVRERLDTARERHPRTIVLSGEWVGGRSVGPPRPVWSN